MQPAEVVDTLASEDSQEPVVPSRAIVDVRFEPGPELFAPNPSAGSALLRMAILGGSELELSATLELILEVSQMLVASDLQVVVFTGDRGTETKVNMTPDLAAPVVPAPESNPLHSWTRRAAKPVLASKGMTAAMDEFLREVGVSSALAVPLFMGRELAGSLQLLRRLHQEFTASDGQLLWLLSLLAETHMVRIGRLRQMTRLAFTDYLTGLKTRGYFEQALEQEVRRCMRRNGSCAVLLLDLDGFKSVNDECGHQAGDDILRQVAAVLIRDMRDIDTVARYGGDEFAVILPDSDMEGARFVAARLREAVREGEFFDPATTKRMQVDASIGVALCPEDEREPGRLLRAADAALYQAKREGKGRLVFPLDLRRRAS